MYLRQIIPSIFIWWRPGDILVVFLGVILSIYGIFGGLGQTDKEKVDLIIIRFQGQVLHQISLPSHEIISVLGKLGETVIQIDGFRVRVLRDPGPRQICVRQGWIQGLQDVLICAPSEVTIEMKGVIKIYDSASY